MQGNRINTHNSSAGFSDNENWWANAGGHESTRSSQHLNVTQQVQGYFHTGPEPSMGQKVWSCIASCCAVIFCCKCCCDEAHFEKAENYGSFAKIAQAARNNDV